MVFGIEFTSPVGEGGKRAFFLHWIDDAGRKRAQIFRTLVWPTIRRLRREGNKVVPLKRWHR